MASPRSPVRSLHALPSTQWGAQNEAWLASLEADDEKSDRDVHGLHMLLAKVLLLRAYVAAANVDFAPGSWQVAALERATSILNQLGKVA